MQGLIDQGIMKQWKQDGIIMCSFRTMTVGKEDGREDSMGIKKATRFLLAS